MLTDGRGRIITDLRLSVTDRCNFFCPYCRDAHDRPIRPRPEILNYEEILRLARLCIGLGVSKIRLTGGEPLLRREIDVLVSELASIPGLQDLAMTTNGFRLSEKAAALRAAGLRRVNISLDSLRPDRFNRMVGLDAFAAVMNGIQAALAAGLEPVRMNAVLIRGENDDEILDFVEFAARAGVEMRFIEFMPIGEGEWWRRERVVTPEEILGAIGTRYDVIPLREAAPGHTARDYSLPALGSTFGIISPVTQPFCSACSRIRITADGQLRTCLFSETEGNLMALLRAGASDGEISEAITRFVESKEAGHPDRDLESARPARRMMTIGG